MAGNDPERARLKSELDSNQREIDQAKRRLDEINNSRNFIKSQIDSQNYKIADLKRTIDEEYQAVGLCRRAGNRYDADNHRYRAESFLDSLSREYDIKNDLYNQLNYYKSDYETALFNLRSAKERKQRVMESFQSRLQFLKSQNEMENTPVEDVKPSKDDQKQSKKITISKKEIEKQMKEREAAEKKRVSKLARLYNEMKPRDAAEAMDALDDDLCIAILQRMDEANAAKVMSEFEASKTARLTQIMYEGTQKKMNTEEDVRKMLEEQQNKANGENSEGNNP